MKPVPKTIFRIFPLSILLLLAGCETSVDFETFNLPQLTIVSQIAPDGGEGNRVYIYTTKSPSDSSQFYTPANLHVEVTEVETERTIQLKASNNSGKTYFIIPSTFLVAGTLYTISANAPGFESAQASTIIPWPSRITNLSIKNSTIDPSELNEFKKIVRYTIQFNIEHFESNRYYHLVFYNEYVGETIPFLIDPELSDNQPFIHHYAYGVLVDRHDLEEGLPLTFNFLDWVVKDNDIKRIYVELRSIPESYYKYQTSLARQLIVRQDPFAEPVIIFNNVQGGFGNFSGFTRNVTSSDFPL